MIFLRFSIESHTVDDLVSSPFVDIDINRNSSATVCHSVRYRFQDCCNVDGGHFRAPKRLNMTYLFFFFFLNLKD